MLRFIHGFDLVGEEIIKVFSAAQYLSSSHILIKNSELKEFVSSRLRLKSSNNKNKTEGLCPVIYIKKIDLTTDTFYLDLINKFTGQEISQLSFCLNIKFNGIIFTSHLIKTKRCDSCFTLGNNKYGLIENFVKLENRILVVYKQIVVLYSPFYSLLRPNIRSRSSICYVSNQYKVVDLRQIKKAIILNISDKEIYVSDFSMSHLFS